MFTIQVGDYDRAGEALKMLLDGNRKGEKGYFPLNVDRFWWFGADKIAWDHPKVPGATREKSFAGYVEAHRPNLKDSRGGWKPWGVMSDSESVIRMYRKMGLK